MHQIIPFVVLIMSRYLSENLRFLQISRSHLPELSSSMKTHCIHIFLSNEEICRFHGFIRKCFPNKNVSLQWHFQSPSCSSIVFPRKLFESEARYKHLATVRTHPNRNMGVATKTTDDTTLTIDFLFTGK